MNQGIRDVPTVRDPAAPPTSPTGSLRRRMHVVKPTRSKRSLTKPENFHEESATESLHESFGWLEQYVDCRMKQDSIKSLASLDFTWSSDDESTTVANHPRHRRTLSRRDSLVDELGESLKRTPLGNVAEETKSSSSQRNF
jgi:predicted metal-dependent hydrolase